MKAYEPIKLNSHSKAESKINSSYVQSWMNKVWNIIADLLVPNTEPQIMQKRDRNGQDWWYVYDPQTGESAWFTSETEVRAWLEGCLLQKSVSNLNHRNPK
ncbi:MAG: hypothetical protein HC865_14215 [Cyanobacteria bacterium RU_5_0]|nr:hypothetical protein [Cyanobacteria bacterium RU_5_0]